MNCTLLSPAVRDTYGRHLRTSGSFFFFQAEDGIRDVAVTGVQTCALPISCEQIQIECRGDACRIVISEKLQLDGFLQIGTEQQGVTGAESSSYLAQELDRKSVV